MGLLDRKRDDEATATAPRETEGRSSFLPNRSGRPRVESFLMRLVATGGIVGIGTALAAILGSQDVDSWIVGLVVALVTVILAALLWSSRTL